MKKIYAIVGKKLSHSFSSSYFKKKFIKEKIENTIYINIELNQISSIKEIIFTKNVLGFNVTIPYKTKIIQYLDYISDEAKEINAVNTVKVINKKLYGFNTDITGFEKSISPIIDQRKTALILGNGGASKAIQFVLRKNKIRFKIVNRNSEISYENINKKMIKNTDIIINCTPIGTSPNISEYPRIPYNLLNSKHLLYDLVYNPKQSQFLTNGLENQTLIKNGEEMLIIQAEESWKIWNFDII